MTRKLIKIDVGSRQSIKAGIKQLRDYRKGLSKKSKEVVSKLIERGIRTAKVNCGEYGAVISFSREIMVANSGGTMGRLVAIGSPVFRMRGGELITMNPLLMAEFGSGFEAEVLDDVPDVGQGTFPGQTHAEDALGWWYTDVETGEWHHSYGEKPTHPMHNAMLTMIRDVNDVLREVFGNG